MLVIDVIVAGVVANLPFTVLVTGASLDIGRLADSVVIVWLLLLEGLDAMSVTVLLS